MKEYAAITGAVALAIRESDNPALRAGLCTFRHCARQDRSTIKVLAE